MSAGDTPERILAILDAAARGFSFPMLDNGYVYPAAARLSAYRDATDWALVVETFGYSPRSGLPDTCITTLASRLEQRHTAANFATPEAYAAHLSAHPHDEQRFVFPIEEGWIDDDAMTIVPGTAAVTLRGHRIELPPPAAYADAGISLDEPTPQVHELCRWLAGQYCDLVLATVAERRGNVPAGLAELLVLDDWRHPDLVGGELPSDSPAVREIAALLASGGPPPADLQRDGNTHWSHWPEGGLL